MLYQLSYARVGRILAALQWPRFGAEGRTGRERCQTLFRVSDTC
jgi:hypothetical protein